MNYFRRLPVFLRVMSIVDYLLRLSAIALLAGVFSSSVFAFPHMSSLAVQRMNVIGVNFSCLSMAISNVIYRYTARFRQPSAPPSPLDTWRLQAQALLWPSIAPICAIVLTLLISPELMAFGLVYEVWLATPTVSFGVLAVIALQNIDAQRRAAPPTQPRQDMAP